MLRVGLTGSIAVGKTFVTSLLAELGCHVLDADDVARQVVMPGSSTLEKVAAEFGRDVLLADGSLDRARMGGIVFADPAKRLLLNSILHPSIIAEQDRMLLELEKKDPNGIAVVDAALMIESGGYKRFDKLIVVHCKPETQLQRLMARSNLSREEAQQRIDSQMSQEEKKSFADYLIDTTNGFEETRRQVIEVHKQLTEASRNRKES